MAFIAAFFKGIADSFFSWLERRKLDREKKHVANLEMEKEENEQFREISEKSKKMRNNGSNNDYWDWL